MNDLIKKIQKKPKHVRSQIIMVTSLVITGIIVLFWVYSLPYRFSNNEQGGLKEDIKPFKILSETLSDTIGGISDTIKR
ncbi:MAG: hypothetical protein US50_C0008G0003 [Candidatus Nomurabacteria bacterium GW2011_GWB1_37_5]|uniref:Uncharacterized protein n=1 Tax=Candidatus Nomurabacteria bacterium GW2011_GWB1_37_5 TaxID=1618742 RepID=A0A0G0H0E7_9BACT|nr:MAG: hypothetical protein US50_C0008G0003 [Candidatus Nomurabacteria bacterium GW2011_GWB1_37_5]